jgi:SAM-dependent methyltransferase
MIDGARITKCNTSSATAEFLLNSFRGVHMRAKIAHWNEFARTRYEKKVAELRYLAPARLGQIMQGFVKEGEEVLDLGCGTGLLGLNMSPSRIVIDGIDFSEEMAKKAKERGYRDIVVANLEQKSLHEIPELHGRKYPVIISCGVYGDFVDYRWLSEAFKFGQERLTLGLAGCNKSMPGISTWLREQGFHLYHLSIREGQHLEDGTRIDYSYVVAKR